MLILKDGEYIEVEKSELPELPAFEIPYEERVVALIREKYSLDEELAIQRQRDTKPEEFQSYFDYCEECKERSKRK